MSDAPVITDGAFDSQNLAFWDPVRREYRAYWRIFTAGVTTEKVWKPGGHRAIRTATSPDFLNWGPHADLTYVDSPAEHLYTNQIKPYYRAPHIFIGFPTRYVERGWSDSMRALPELEHREAARQGQPALRHGADRRAADGQPRRRALQALERSLPPRPASEREGTWHYGHQYIAWHVVETASAIEGAPNELSLYAGESYWTGNSSALRRYTLRLDGFVSALGPVLRRRAASPSRSRSPASKLTLNFSTSAAGGVRVELQAPDGQPIPGFALADCQEVFGDEIAAHRLVEGRPPTWASSPASRSACGSSSATRTSTPSSSASNQIRSTKYETNSKYEGRKF